MQEEPALMAWTWRYEDNEGNEVRSIAGAAPEFPTQADAESWLGEAWRDLLERGVDAVRLYEDGGEVYGPMSLHPAD
jgi:hypothetical protein